MASLTLTPNIMAAPSIFSDENITASRKLILKNVRLEIGFEYEENEVISTKTDLFLIEIENGKIINISPNNANAKAIDVKGFLMLPAFKDMHIHLDKTFYGDKWQAVRKRKGGVKGMIELEEKLMPELLKTSTQKAEKMIELLHSKGTSFARSHVNIEPTSKLDSLKNLQIALENKKKTFGAELVAFPQHGVFYKNSVPYLKEAATMDIDFIGGVDPYTIDGAIEKTLDFTVQLALDHQKGIDIHLHETGESGLKTVEYLIDKVNENPALKGKTFLSHCFILGKLDKNKQEEIAEKLGDAKVGIASTIPFGNLIMPLLTLQNHGVTVYTGNDSIVDHWNTYGIGSVLEKANLYAQLYGQSTEFMLSRCLKLATANVLPLDDQGNQQWPKVGDDATLVFLDASCSAEAVSRISDVKSLIHQGNIVF
ncbi:amidohydrolase [Chryseobacterium sp. 09-1422]|uniref:Amidohydrolase n=2 Tax=Chryseobacterium kimseyorum TaxID=2984028 RepID=A0ABT3HTG6_9FLAO|nr:amidohydrolase [Chryseobacterium kimseyorum]MCW3166958.1 amidohydrolase [Chryseobacterium kimseyorum]